MGRAVDTELAAASLRWTKKNHKLGERWSERLYITTYTTSERRYNSLNTTVGMIKHLIHETLVYVIRLC